MKILKNRLFYLAVVAFCFGIAGAYAQPCSAVTDVSITPNTTQIKIFDCFGNLKDGNVTFTANATGATSYEWYVDGAFQTGASTDNFIFVVPAVEGVHSVYAAAVNACTESNTAKSAEVTVIVTKDKILSQLNPISGSATVCENTTNLTYSVNEIEGVTYTWTLPADWTQTAGGTTHSITVTAGSASGTITVTSHNDGCGGTPQTLPVSVESIGFTLDLASDLGKTASSYTAYNQAPNKWAKNGASGGADLYMIDKIVVTSTGTTPTVVKWAESTQNKAWFESNGTAFTLADGIPATTNGTFSVYLANANCAVAKTITATDIRDGSVSMPYLMISGTNPQVSTLSLTPFVMSNSAAIPALGLDKNYELYENITLSGQWTPIGTTEGVFNDPWSHTINPQNGLYFAGTFNGNGKTISNLTITADDTDFKGLFGATDWDSSVENLILSDVNIDLTNAKHVGAVVGFAWGAISNVSVVGNSKVHANNFVGGIAGSLRGYWRGAGDYNAALHETTRGYIGNCHVTGTSSIQGNNYVSGVVGYGTDATLSGCYNVTNITGQNCVGGLNGANTSLYIKGSTVQYNTGNISGVSSVGGIVGNIDYSQMKNVYNTGNITGTGDNVGGIAGGGVSYEIEAAYATGTITGQNSVGGIFGKSHIVATNPSKYCYFNGTVNGSGSNVGGVGGMLVEGAEISYSYSMGTVTGTGDNVGGVTGYSSGVINSCYSTSEVSGASNVAGITGQTAGGGANVSNSIAMNNSITGTGSNVHRVIGYQPSGSIGDNYGYVNTMVNSAMIGGTPAANGLDGANATYTNLLLTSSVNISAWYTAAPLNWLSTVWERNPDIGTTSSLNLPILTSVKALNATVQVPTLELPPCFSLTGVTVASSGGTTIVVGTATTLSSTLVPTSATGTFAYQWQRSTNAGQTWTDISGATSASYSVPTTGGNAITQGVNDFRVVVTVTGGCGATPQYGYITILGEVLGQDLDAVPPPNFMPYVGAFWKANQTGERLIRMSRPTTRLSTTTEGYYDSGLDEWVWTKPVGQTLTGAELTVADGDWRATVLVGGDWIELDNVMTSDNNVGWRLGAIESSVVDMSNPTNDNTHRIPAGTGVQSVTGTMNASNPDIYFRIGLKSAYTPTTGAPARYGIVLVTYAGNSKAQRIFVRQGEGADYLMRPDDALETGSDPAAGARTTTNTKKFSPYNLTANTLNAANNASSRKFTDYPSQAGGLWLFMGTGTYAQYAWDASSVSVTGNATDNSTTLWNTTNETCPAGFRRATDGSTTAITTGGLPNPPATPIPSDYMVTTALMPSSEIRHSLYLKQERWYISGSSVANPTNYSNHSNAVWGYYADGFFDRRNIVNAPNMAGGSGEARSAVSVSSANIAYAGLLFWNPNNNASLFFPGTGYRGIAGAANSTSYLVAAGNNGCYLTSSTPYGSSGNYGASVYMGFGSDATNGRVSLMIDGGRGLALSIRCVADE